MGVKDTKAKEYLSDNHRFADLCNFYFFKGKEVVQPEDLEPQDTTEVLSVFGGKETELQIQKWRDLLKRVIIKRTKDYIYVIIGIENQTEIHYAMPVKNMIYDAINYGKQVNEAAKKHRKRKDFKNSREFLSGFSKDDRITPVVTLTLYWGAEAWDAPRSIHDMLLPVEKSMLSYIPDYKLNLILPNEIDDFEKFKTSLGAVLEMIKYSKDEAAMEKVITEKPIYRNLEIEAVKTINMFTGLHIEMKKEEETMDMCKAWADHKKAGIEEGIRTGIKTGIEEGRAEEIVETGYEFHLSESDILDRLQKKLNVPMQKAQEYLNMFGKKTI